MKLKILIFLSMWVLLLGLPSDASAGEVAVIINSENAVSELSPAEVRAYLMKERVSWPNGKKVRSVDRKGESPEREVYLKDIVQMTSEQLEKYWVSIRYKNGIPVPPKLNGDAQTIEYVQSFPGAIGYVNAASIQDNQRATLKIVRTFPME